MHLQFLTPCLGILHNGSLTDMLALGQDNQFTKPVKTRFPRWQRIRLGLVLTGHVQDVPEPVVDQSVPSVLQGGDNTTSNRNGL